MLMLPDAAAAAFSADADITRRYVTPAEDQQQASYTHYASYFFCASALRFFMPRCRR